MGIHVKELVLMFGHQMHQICRHLLSSVVIHRNIIHFSVHFILIAVCITNCNASHIIGNNDINTNNIDINHNIDPNVNDINFAKYSTKLLKVFKRDVNANSLHRILCETTDMCHKRFNKNTICRAGRCDCSEGSRPNLDNSTCIPNHITVNDEHNQSTNDLTGDELDENGEKKEKYNGSHMLPIMIVLGIMFIGMCVALNLFSRARFRQSRSGIFSKPHLIKFNNSSTSSGKKRRSSPPNPNSGGGGGGPSTGHGTGSISLPDKDLPKNGSYVSIALES